MRTKDFDEQEVLKRAIRIFWEKGYYATSLHDLIEALGIGRSSIYHTFGDKHQLFVKALTLYQTEGTARILHLIENQTSLKIALQRLLTSVINEIVESSCPKGCFKINSEVEIAAQDDIIKKLVYNDDLLIEDALCEAFKKAQKTGEIDNTKDPLALAHFFRNTITGMRVYAKFRNERQFFEDIAKVALTVID
ncbi:MAG: TetR/AcrR family transcriptional regulator, partial [Flavobacterium sp.]